MLFDLICAVPGTSLDSIWTQYLAEYENPQAWKYPKPEEWRQVILEASGKQPYEVSNWGRVRHTAPQELQKPCRVGKYAVIYLGNGIRKYVHRLVLTAFVGPAPGETETCHWNDVGIDNRIGNLRWDAPRNNKMDTKFTGENRKQVYVPAISRSAGQWICDADCNPASPRLSNFLLDRWRINDHRHDPFSDRSWALLEENMELMALEVAQNDRAA